MSKEENL
jgi:hypothetical protein